MAPRAKNKLAFIDRTLTKPTLKDNTNFAEANVLEMVNSMIASWIMNVIDPKLHPSAAYVDSAQRMWENIRKRYSIPNVPRIHQLKAAIASCRQEEQEVVDFFSQLMSLSNELDDYTKVPSCTYGAVEMMAKMLEQEKVHQFLMGLNDESFSTIRSQILALDPLPALDRVFNMVQQEEHHKRIMGTREPRCETAAAVAVTHSGKQYRERQQDQG